MTMGYESGPQVHTEPYGKPGLTLCCGEMIQVKSQAEVRLAEELEMCWNAKAIRDWQYEPTTFEYKYKYRGHQCVGTYTPDFRAEWAVDGEEWYEVKRGHITQKAANKVKYFVEQYPEKKLVLVWVGSLPKKGKKKKYFDKAARFAHHVWHIKSGTKHG